VVAISFLDDRLIVHHLLHVANFPHFPHSRYRCRRLAAVRPLVLARDCRRVERGRTSAFRNLPQDHLFGSLAARNTERSNCGTSQGPPDRTCTGLARRIVLATSGGHVTASTQRSSGATVHRSYPVPDGTTRAHYGSDDLHHDAALSDSADISSQFGFVYGSRPILLKSLFRGYIFVNKDVALVSCPGEYRIEPR